MCHFPRAFQTNSVELKDASLNVIALKNKGFIVFAI